MDMVSSQANGRFARRSGSAGFCWSPRKPQQTTSPLPARVEGGLSRGLVVGAAIDYNKMYRFNLPRSVDGQPAARMASRYRPGMVSRFVCHGRACHFHRPSATAIVADLIQTFSDSFLREHWGWWRFLARLDGLTQDQACAPLEWRLSFINRAPARRARDKVLSWNCQRVIVAHGELPRENGNAFLAKSFRWLGRSGR
jgi:hypothetical protein